MRLLYWIITIVIIILLIPTGIGIAALLIIGLIVAWNYFTRDNSKLVNNPNYKEIKESMTDMMKTYNSEISENIKIPIIMRSQDNIFEFYNNDDYILRFDNYNKWTFPNMDNMEDTTYNLIINDTIYMIRYDKFIVQFTKAILETYLDTYNYEFITNTFPLLNFIIVFKSMNLFILKREKIRIDIKCNISDTDLIITINNVYCVLRNIILDIFKKIKTSIPGNIKTHMIDITGIKLLPK